MPGKKHISSALLQVRELKNQVAFLLRKNDNDDKLISALKVIYFLPRLLADLDGCGV